MVSTWAKQRRKSAQGAAISNSCIPEDELRAYQRGELPDPIAARTTRHLEECPICEASAQRLDGLTDPLLGLLRRSPGADNDELTSAALPLTVSFVSQTTCDDAFPQVRGYTKFTTMYPAVAFVLSATAKTTLTGSFDRPTTAGQGSRSRSPLVDPAARPTQPRRHRPSAGASDRSGISAPAWLCLSRAAGGLPGSESSRILPFLA